MIDTSFCSTDFYCTLWQEDRCYRTNLVDWHDTKHADPTAYYQNFSDNNPNRVEPDSCAVHYR